jgi:hypothetical protein
MQQNKLLQGQVQLQQPQIDSAKLELMQKQVGAFRSSLGTLLAGSPTTADIVELGSTGMKQGWFTPEQFAAEVSSWPGDGVSADARKKWVQSHYVRQLGHEQQIDLMLGRPTPYNVGNQTLVKNVSPLSGVRDAPGGAMTNYMPPASAAQPVDGPPDANGAPTRMPAGAFAERTGMAPAGTYSQPQAGSYLPATVQNNGSPPPPMSDGSRTAQMPQPQPAPQPVNRLPMQPAATGGQPGMPMARPPMQPQPAPQASPNTMTTGLAPGVSKSMEDSASAYSTLKNDVGSPQGSASRIYALRSAMSALDGTQTGLGTEGRQRIASYLSALPGGVGKWLPGVDPQSISDYDLARKFLTAYSMNAPGANRSDAGLTTASNANASVTISPEAAKEVVRSNIGLERMRQAQVADFESSGRPPGQFSSASAEWNRKVDPKAFAVDMMSPADRQKYISGLSTDAQKRFLDSVRIGIKTGVIDRSALAGGQ